MEVPTGLAGGGRPGRLWKRPELSTEGLEACEPWRLAAHLTPELCPQPQGSRARPVFKRGAAFGPTLPPGLVG